MSASAGRAHDRARTPLRSIGEVLAELKPEFADLSHSKLRFLEDRGLIRPQRTPSGYRKFSPADVERVRLVLALQRDHFMPLKAIAEYLDALDRGLEPPELPGGRPRVPRVVPDMAGGADQRGQVLRLRRAELLEATGAQEELLGELEEFGLVSADGGFYGGHDVDIVRAAREMAAYGIQPRHLRIFRTAADRELGLVEQVVAPMRHHRGAASAAQAQETARELSSWCVRLHAGLVRAGLERQGR